MSTSLLVVSLLVICGVHAAFGAMKLTGDPDADFQNFMSSFRKRYATREETVKRFTIWKDNVKIIEQHNAKAKRRLVSFTLGVNEYTDLVRAALVTPHSKGERKIFTLTIHYFLDS